MNETFYQDLDEAKKYEELIFQFLQEDFFVYKIVNENERHIVEHIVEGILISKRTQKFYLFEVKAREPRRKYNDFSIKNNQLEKYLKVLENNNMSEQNLLFFIFNKTNNTCYVSNLENLRAVQKIKNLQYPLNTGFITYFSFASLYPIFEYEITDNKVIITNILEEEVDEEIDEEVDEEEYEIFR